MAKSIMTDIADYCYLCGRRASEVHHIFYGTANRTLSEKWGLTIPICASFHRGDHGVHHDRELDLQLKKAGQAMWERRYGKTSEDFIKEFGKNYR